MTRIILITCFLFSIAVNAQHIDTSNRAKNEIREFLNKFQAGYTLKDVSKIKEWTHELMTDDVYILGTNGVFPNTGEWQVGIDKAEKLFANDWKYWGVLDADIQNADIRILSPTTAMVALKATVTKSPGNGYGRTNEANMERSLTRLAGLKDDSSKTTRQKLYTAVWDVGIVLKNIGLGETFIWPIRISMVLIKKDGKWKMAQTHYSYPMSGYPPVRLVDGKVINY